MTEVVLAIALGFAVVVIVMLVRRRRDLPVVGDLHDDDPSESAETRAWATDILDHLEEGVVVLSEAMTPILANRAARSTLGMQNVGLPVRLTAHEVTSVARRALVEGRTIESSLNIREGAGSYLHLRAVPLDDPSGVLVSLRDTTVEQHTQHLRRQFVANASHELKTPVASMQALAEALVTAVGRDPEAASRFGDRVVVESQRLSHLVDDLLDLSRVEDPTALNAADVDLSELVRIQVKAFEAEAEAKRITLQEAIAPAVHVIGDDAQLELMVRNLIDNAIRYTDPEGHVNVRLSVDTEDATLDIGDDGPGIPLRAQARVFERFFRVDDDRARAGGGTGLGLAIVKNVAESHAGNVTLVSELDAGSTFTVRLPLGGDRS
ncbi:MAG TPA: HAMP domain-containing sensor histidine kinase [Actinomycetota bacterium]|nr:HAMP domain-containing sensor histidine kinase [Actinomycetota bacterium]